MEPGSHGGSHPAKARSLRRFLKSRKGLAMSNALQNYYREESEIPDGWVPLSGYDDSTRTPRNGNTHSREYKRLWDAIKARELDCLQKYLGLGQKGGKMFVRKKQADEFLASHEADIEAECADVCEPLPEAAEDFGFSYSTAEGRRISAALEDIAALLRQAIAAFQSSIN